MKLKTRFNVGDTVYIVKGFIVKDCIDSIEITAYGNEQKDACICYKFSDGFGEDYLKTETEVFATKEEAVKYLDENVYDNTCQKSSYID